MVRPSTDKLGWYSQSLQLLHVIKSPTLNRSDLIFHQLPTERGQREDRKGTERGQKKNLRDDVMQCGFDFFRSLQKVTQALTK